MSNARKNRIKNTINNALTPVFIEIINESNQHNVPEASETHFKITVVCQQFESQSLIMRHRTINALLKDEFNSGLHALAIHAYTLEKWQLKNQSSPSSPKCLDGFKNK